MDHDDFILGINGRIKNTQYSVKVEKMFGKILLIVVLFGCLNAAPQSIMPGSWYNISVLDRDLVGLCVRGINFINNELNISPPFRFR
jgi:hypothetical protein